MRKLICCALILACMPAHAVASPDDQISSSSSSSSSSLAGSSSSSSSSEDEHENEDEDSSSSSSSESAVCDEVQHCISSGLDQLVASCVQSTTTCGTVRPDKFALSADDLAERAAALARCQNARRRSDCNKCYERAARPLRSRYNVSLFKGALGQASLLLKQEKKQVCGALKR